MVKATRELKLQTNGKDLVPGYRLWGLGMPHHPECQENNLLLPAILFDHYPHTTQVLDARIGGLSVSPKPWSWV
jgi:hypothetical protein